MSFHKKETEKIELVVRPERQQLETELLCRWHRLCERCHLHPARLALLGLGQSGAAVAVAWSLAEGLGSRLAATEPQAGAGWREFSGAAAGSEP